VGRTLGDIAERLGIPCDPDSATITIASVGIDSRSLSEQSLWVAYRGAATHAAHHAAPNAVAALTDDEGAQLLADRGLPCLVVSDPRHIAGLVASWVLDEPSADLTVVGVTGTNGKTTVTHVLESAWRAAGECTGIIGTLGARIDDRDIPLARTTPEATEVHALVARMRDSGVQALAMEVSSHALVLGRVEGVAFNVAVFTNLSEDHLDFHRDMEDYFQAKAALFDPARTERAVVCIDDEWGLRLAQRIRGTMPLLTYGMRSDADVSVGITGFSRSGMNIQMVMNGQAVQVSTPLVGSFNAVNLAGAAAALLSLGLEPEDIASRLGAAQSVPGRMERIADQPAVIVDYAHTPDAVRTVLTALRASVESASEPGRLITVLGCGGDRDPHKRPVMGRLAAQHSDLVFITDDNPRSEDPAVIRGAVLEGARDGAATVHETADRADAIRAAIEAAAPLDVVVILGKGAEQGQEVAGHMYPFDDRVVAREVLAARMES
jgi:UDP-N-acetylmuramoyl-L-alanyl-D-glutamate--2,6-diaminopimelate ligase